MNNRDSFFDTNTPQFTPETVETFSRDYLEHFRTGNTSMLLLWMQTQFDRLSLPIENELTGKTVQKLIKIAQTDVEQVLATDPSLEIEGDAKVVIGHYPGFEAITIQRLAHFLYNQKIAELPRALTELTHRKTGIDIHPGAQIGTHFFIDHGTGIVIGETAIIGNNVVLYHGVTLGNRSEPRRKQSGKKRHPTLEDGVTVFANATVLGGNTVVGSGAKIGTGAIVTRSVSPGLTVPFGTTF